MNLPEVESSRALLRQVSHIPLHRDLAAHRELYWGQLLTCLAMVLDRLDLQQQEIERLRSSVRRASDDAIRAPDA